ncbi:helix-turn-helix domain-containing protein [Gudongella sp. SC589]|uniref:helix-turn-helix domain-containing protein n=1 Tax=Gudongella sp. SC589 TaxID=3385990 RepID=UPI003904B48C
MLFGKKVEIIRKKRKLSYGKLAELSGISSRSYIRNIENGIVADPALRTVMKLAKGLGVSIGELLGDVDIKD